MAFAAVNIYFATNRMVAIYMWIKVLEYTLLGFYIIQTKPKFSSAILYLSVGVFWSSLIAIGQFLLQHTIGLWILGERAFTADTPGIARYGTLLRSYATFPHPNVLGGFLAILLPLIIFQIKNKKQIFFIVTAAFGCVALVLTFSRSAWVAFFIGLAITQKKMRIPLCIIFAVFSLWFVKTIRQQDESVVVRQQLNNSATAMFFQSPIIGKGMGNFLVELPNHLVSRQIYFLQPAHNMFFIVLSETGIVGFAIFCWLLWRRKTPILAVAILLGLVDHYFLTIQQGQLLLTILLSGTIAL